VLPPFEELPGNDFATIDGFLRFQRWAVSAARGQVEALADLAWGRLADDQRTAFGEQVGDVETLDVLWRRAWWLRAIGGRPRAPLEIATAPALAERLVAALGSHGPPASLAEDIERWWATLTERCRARVAEHTWQRVDAARARLIAEAVIVGGVEAGGGGVPARGRGSDRGPVRRTSRADARRTRAAVERAIASHQALDKEFERLGPVCGACTRETGGCCTLTVPLLWREADFRLLALGAVAPVWPASETPGTCPFLGVEGCRLPSERRSHICRSFLCERAEAALANHLGPVRQELARLGAARSQLG
jgi:hypothetical protein